LGPNGAGKTTTVECIEGLRKPDSGRIRVLGLDPTRQVGELRQRIGCQLQESALPDRIKVWEALDVFGSFSPRHGDRQAALEAWGLQEKRNTAFGSLSGGQQQRLFIALALLNQPEVVFLDELTQGLDPAARRVAWDLVRAVRDRGATVVLVTHFMDEAQHLCDRIAVVDHGRVIATDSPQGLINRYGGGVRVVFSVEPERDVGWLNETPHVTSVTRSGPRVEVAGDRLVMVHVAAGLLNHGLEPDDLRLDQPTLEDVFLNVTGGVR
jgi:ABC-2 type transport system ATP-binding protein